MAARFARITSITSRSHRQLLRSFRNCDDSLYLLKRNACSFSRLFSPKGCFKETVMPFDCFKVSYVNLRGFSASSSNCAKIEYSDIPRLLKEPLKSRGNEKQVFETQMEVLEKLIQHKEGSATIDELRAHVSYLSPKHIYELADSIYGLNNMVEGAASELAAPLFWMASVAGNIDAKYSYAKLLKLGEGVDPDPIEAGKLLKELSDKGHPLAQHSLALMYYTGVGVDQDYELARSLLEVSIKNGIIAAYAFLGNMYRNGQGVEEDKTKALEIFKLGVEKGDPGCMMCLAFCYGQGDGVDKSQEKSFEYCQLAANKGDTVAQYNLGVHYFSGKGVTLDMSKAAECFQAAADKGFALAQMNLGNMYFNGLGVGKDLHKARDWFKKASEINKRAKGLLEEVESELAEGNNAKPS